MRYSCFVSVKFILIDGRSNVKLLRPVLFQALMALNDRFDHHVVVLCASPKAADAIDSLGEECGQGLFFHGEYIESDGEFRDLLDASKLIVLLAKSRADTFEMFKAYNSNTPLLLVTKSSVTFYDDVRRPENAREMAPFNCFITLGGLSLPR